MKLRIRENIPRKRLQTFVSAYCIGQFVFYMGKREMVNVRLHHTEHVYVDGSRKDI